MSPRIFLVDVSRVTCLDGLAVSGGPRYTPNSDATVRTLRVGIFGFLSSHRAKKTAKGGFKSK